MDAITLLKLQAELGKIASTSAPVVLPKGTMRAPRRKQVISPEAEEVYRELQQTPTNIFAAQTGVPAAAASTAAGGAVGAGLGSLLTGTSVSGFKTPLSTKKMQEMARQAETMSKGEQVLARTKAGRPVRVLGALGAAAGLGTNLYYQARRSKLRKKLEQALNQSKGKEKAGADLLLMAARIKASRLLEG